jgi:transcriptional regulator with XRE-family HTH domain
MKQPELGRKISELRKAKGLTQEELVERCNISVRTIQRIETGEVTPRSYTIKTILSALDYDLEKISDEEAIMERSGSNWLKNFLLIDIDVNKPSGFLITQLNAAWIFGICYFVLSFVEAPIEYWRFKEDELLIGIPAYIALKVFLLISLIYFQRGFILTGELFNNYLLKIISLVVIGAHMLLIVFDIVSVFYDSIEPQFIMFPAALLFGVIGFVYGIALRRLGKTIGQTAEAAGLIEILAACFFLTVVLAFIGDFIHVPAELLEIIILYKTINIIKSKEVEGNFAE